MKHRLRKIVKWIVDVLLRWASLPTYSEFRSECRQLIEADIAWFGSEECSRFESIKKLLRRSL